MKNAYFASKRLLSKRLDPGGISNIFLGKKGREKIRVLLVLIFGEKIIKVGGGLPPPPNRVPY